MTSTASYKERVAEKLKGCAPDEIAFLSDFDGTISVRDVQVGILDRFAREDWRAAEREVLDAGQKSRLYLPVIYKGFRGTEEGVLNHIREQAMVDPDFPRFVDYCRDMGWELRIVSDGLGIYIGMLLERHGLGLPYHSNIIEFRDDGDPLLSFPNHNPGCGKCGSCKLSRVEDARARGKRFIGYAGDGISDECVAAHVDMLFAKDSLLAYCQTNGLDCLEFTDFKGILSTITSISA